MIGVHRSRPEPSAENRSRRANTAEEKRRMRNARKRRMRKIERKPVRKLKRELKEERTKADIHAKRIIRLTAMARSYWERWRWELQKRQETLLTTPIDKITKLTNLHEIDEAFLLNLKGGEKYLGRGCFGIVKLQVYRGILVAVKQLLPQSLKEDVQHEAEILSQLCHPYLPYLFGVITKRQPYSIIMQFHGLKDISYPYSLTLHCELHHKKLGLNSIEWLLLCGQLLEAVVYLHCSASLLHNDIKGDNIVIGHCQSNSTTSYQILLVDFGKACMADRGKKLILNAVEQEEHIAKFPHIAPEVLKGECSQTTLSDMFSLGRVFCQIASRGGQSTACRLMEQLNFIGENCRHVKYQQRYSAQQALSVLHKYVMDD